MDTQLQQALKEIEDLKKDLKSLNDEYNRNNFTARQDFQKYSDFKTMMKVPHYDSLPATCQVGELVESGGKLRICSTTDTWTICGTQS